MVPLLLLFGEITPKTIAVSNPVQVSSRIVCGPMDLWLRVVTPLRWLIRILADRITTWIVGETRDADHILRISEFRSLVAEIEEEGLLNATDRVLVYNLLDAGNTEVIHIMTPRTQMHFVEQNSDLSEAIDALTQHRLACIPVYADTRDNICGFIHMEDGAEEALDKKSLKELTCRDILRPPLFVPLTKSVDELLDFFQTRTERAAIVLNEYGGVAGMVMMEDAVNFIFGEIAGEYPDKDTYTREAADVYVVSGYMKLNDFEALTNFGIEDPRMTTIGGVVMRYLGRLPKKGDTVTIEDVKITVLEMQGNRIDRLRVSKTDAAEEDKKHDNVGTGRTESHPENEEG
jgi:CBS domain containing-hemolysin-like protein